MELENQIPEEEVSILTLTDENGQDTDFEYLDCIEYKGKEYLVLMPADEMATEIVILEIEPVDEENENYLSVSDEKILNEVYSIFKEKYKDVLTFEEYSPSRHGKGCAGFSVQKTTRQLAGGFFSLYPRSGRLEATSWVFSQLPSSLLKVLRYSLESGS